MRKILALFLALCLSLCCFGCGKQDSQPTSPAASATTREKMLSVSLDMAQLLGNTVKEGMVQALAAPAEIVSMAEPFSAAADPNQVTSGALIRTDHLQLPTLITQANATLGNNAVACAGVLQFATRMTLSEHALGQAAVYLRYGDNCHLIVSFAGTEDAVTTVTVFPVMPAAAEKLMKEVFTDSAPLTKEQLTQAHEKCQGADFSAKPTNSDTPDAYYADLAADMFRDALPPKADAVSEYITDADLLQYTMTVTKYLSLTTATCSIYRFPADLEQQIPAYQTEAVEELYRQKLYTSWPTGLCATLGEEALLVSAVLNSTMTFSSPGALANEEEVPVILVLDYNVCTVLVALYPTQYNTYLSSVTILSCEYAQACQLLTQQGATVR